MILEYRIFKGFLNDLICVFLLMIIFVRIRLLGLWRLGLKEFHRAFGRGALAFLYLADTCILWWKAMNRTITQKGEGVTLNLAMLRESWLFRFQRLRDGGDSPETVRMVHTGTFLSQPRHRVYVAKVWVGKVVGGLHIKSLQVLAAYLCVIKYVRRQLHLLEGDPLGLMALHWGQSATYLVSSHDCNRACHVFQMERRCLAIHCCLASLLLFWCGKSAFLGVAQNVLNSSRPRVWLIGVCCHHRMKDFRLLLQMSSISIVLLCYPLIIIVWQYNHVLGWENPCWLPLPLCIQRGCGSRIQTLTSL